MVSRKNLSQNENKTEKKISLVVLYFKGTPLLSLKFATIRIYTTPDIKIIMELLENRGPHLHPRITLSFNLKKNPFENRG